MGVMLVGDNHRNNNWGARAATHALLSMLNGQLSAGPTVEGREFLMQAAGYGYVGPLLPARFGHGLLQCRQNRDQRRLYDWCVRLEEALGAHDFVSPDPVETVRDILRYRGRFPELAALYDKTKQAEVVVINGEGDFVFTTPPRRAVLFMLGMMELAFRLRKRVFFVNAMLSDCLVTGRDEQTVAATRRQLARADGVFLRDPMSMQYVREHMPEVACTLVPDALFVWQSRAAAMAAALPGEGDMLVPYPERSEWLGRLDFSRRYICVGGGAAAATDRARAIVAYTRLVERLKELELPVYVTENDGRDSFLEEVARRTGVGVVPVWTPIYGAFGILARASLFVSGRYHAAILASEGGTPCVFLGSTAHKMTSLQTQLGYTPPRTFSACPSEAEVDEIVQLARGFLEAGPESRQRLVSVAASLGHEAARLPALIEQRLHHPTLA